MIVMEVFATLIVSFSFLIIPVYRKNESYFGVRVTEDFYLSDDGKKYFKRWYLSIGFFTIIILAVQISSFLSDGISEWTNFLIPGFVLFHGVLYARTYTVLKKHEFLQDIQSPRVAAYLGTRNLRDFLNPWVEITAFLLIVIPVIMLISKFDSLPEKFPVHWNFRGKVDSYSDKSVGGIFSPTFISVGIYLSILLISRFIVKSKISLPDACSMEYARLKFQQITVFVRIMDMVKLGVMITFSFISMIPILITKFSEETVFEAAMFINIIVIAMIITAVIILLIKNININKQLRDISGTVNIGYRDEAKFWKWGIFYINPNDPAVWVERRDGLGYTINLGHAQGLLVLALLLGIPLAIILVVVLTN
jgi:uncharacterized membrane protein